MKNIAAAISFSIIFTSCHSLKTIKMTDSQDHALKANKITVRGIYTKSIMSQKPSNENYGHYKIAVNDTFSVNLLQPYMKASVRSKAEAGKMEGKMVEVTGEITDRTYFDNPHTGKSGQWVNIPCFNTIEDIHLVQ